MSETIVYKYYILHKPFGYLSQFTGEPGDLLLGDLFPFPKDVYSVGRLDKDSEGLLLLTNDNNLKTKLLDPKNDHPKTYWVQVDGQISKEAVSTLSEGSIVIKHNGKPYRVKKSQCKIIDPPQVVDRVPPIRVRKNIPTSWISLEITEGKNRQVRKMVAAVGYPCLRLIRTQIGELDIEGLKTGDVKELTREEIRSFLGF